MIQEGRVNKKTGKLETTNKDLRLQ